MIKIKNSAVFYVLFITLFTLLSLEITARYYLSNVLQKSSNRKFRFNYHRVYEHVPNFREGDGIKDWIVINSNGFRRQENVKKEKSADTYRVFILGGSTAHGMSSVRPYPIRHIYPDETIDAYMEADLRKIKKKVEIINAAVAAYQVYNHTQYLMTEILDYSPDLVIFFDGANDHYINNPNFNYISDNRYQFWKSRLQEPSIKGLFDYSAYYMANYSGLFRGYFSRKLQKDALSNNKKINSNVSYKNDIELIENYKLSSKKGYLRSIRMNLDLLKSEGIDAIIALQPLLVLRDPNLLSKEERSFLHQDVEITKLNPYVVNDLKSLASSYGISFIDYNPIFNDPKYKGKQLYIDYVHFTPLGGKVAADSLTKLVLNRID